MPSLPPALKEACTTADISAMLHSMHAASHHPAPWLSPSAAFLLGAVACLACLLAGWVTLQRSSSLRSKLEGLAKAAREGLSPATLSSLFGGDLPAWLAYPDVSRMEWANVALKGLWPQIDAAATKWAVLDGNLEPLLNGTTFWRPAWLASSGISVKGLALGNQPPVITGVRAYARDEDTCTDRVMVDFHFTWSSKMEGEFIAACAWLRMDIQVLPENARLPIIGQLAAFITRRSIVRVFVKDLVVSGTLRTQLRPLLNEIPVVGAAKVSFLGTPVFSYKVSSYGVNPLFIPGLEHFINGFVSGTVLQPFTYPDGFVVKLDPGADDSVAELPEGLLTVVIKEATGVPRMDLIGGADPFVKLWVAEGTKLNTSVKARTRHPRWNETFRMTVHDVAHQSLRLILLDADALRADDEVGRVELALADLDLSQPRDLVVTVPRTGRRERKHRSDQVGFTAAQARVAATPGVGGESGRGLDLDGHATRTGPAGPARPADEGRGESEGSNGDRGEEAREEEGKKAGVVRHDAAAAAEGVPLWREEEPETAPGQTSARQRVAFTRFDRQDIARAMEAAREGRAPSRNAGGHRDQSANSRALHSVFSGGVLYVHLDHGTDLASEGLEGYTKNMRCRLTVGSHSRETECSRSKLLNRRNPVFDQKLELILDGDEAAEQDAVVRVDLYTVHLILKPTYKGHVAVPLQEVVSRRRVTGTWPLQGVSSGQLSMNLTWVNTLEQGP
ncbi:Extended synaptotagmin-3 [Auxenochlorella protothecoides]|uniref:Extended synaptotagmin-3 n=1 Tax=Auxenochlorella protothecoides TaxID=3075 RepID=A0A087SC88_AUXPR|nr:Extended synaptotagmin-3 [Auxenochlorella protothecoides]KFM23342.1 Extended synaptotagmin-3 [Auxenochlorella protothecoides]